VITTGVAHWDPSGSSPRQNAGAGGRLLGGVGQPGVDREERRLHREGDEEADEEPLLGVRVDGDALQVAEQVRRRATARGHDVQPDHRGEHHQPAGELEDQELHRGPAASVAAEPADQEVRRDQRRLEHHVEQEHVGGGEHSERQRLEGQRPGEEGLGVAVVGVEPGGADDHGHQHRGQQHEDQRHAVDSQRVVSTEDVDPLVGLGELEAAAVGVELRRRHHAHAQGDERGDERGLLGQRALGAEGHGQGADERDQPEDRQEREVGHARFTARRARTTRSTPPRRDRA
jgi:hypothetical protein